MNDKTKKRVCLYCRISTNDKGQDINRQVNELREVVNNNGWILTDIYTDEGFSRSTTTRPELDRMMKDSFSKRFDMVMTLELSRLGCNLKHMIDVVDTLKQRGVDLWVKNQMIDTSQVGGMLVYNILNSISSYEMELTKQRVKSGLENWKKKNPDLKLGRPSNLNYQTRQKIIEMKSQNIGMKKISQICKVGRKTILDVVSNTL
jgi:DNA invertase Pin-like site-specific DNA recombinase